MSRKVTDPIMDHAQKALKLSRKADGGKSLGSWSDVSLHLNSIITQRKVELKNQVPITPTQLKLMRMIDGAGTLMMGYRKIRSTTIDPLIYAGLVSHSGNAGSEYYYLTEFGWNELKKRVGSLADHS